MKRQFYKKAGYVQTPLTSQLRNIGSSIALLVVVSCPLASGVSQAQTNRNGAPFGESLAPKPTPAPFPPPIEPIITRPTAAKSAPPPSDAQWAEWCRPNREVPESSVIEVTTAEPALVGRIVDSENRQSLKGVVVFGYYGPIVRTVENGKTQTWGPGSQCSLHNFEALTDADGKFTISGWRGDPASNHPDKRDISIVFFRAGYDTTGLNLGYSMRGWRRAGQTTGSTDAVIDNSSAPISLQRIRPYESRADQVEDRHWHSHIRAAFAQGYEGACGWEQYPTLLTALHKNRKDLIRMSFAPKDIGADGYPTPAALGADRGSDYAQRSEVDQLRTLYAQSRNTWACANPNDVFRNVK